MATSAARRALDAARMHISDIDLVISACAVSFQTIPTLSLIIAQELSAKDSSFASMNVNTTCPSILSAFDLASTLIVACRNKTVSGKDQRGPQTSVPSVSPHAVSHASVLDTVAFLKDVVVPIMARGR
nr:hypothetical protein [Paracoccus saliphilus]